MRALASLVLVCFLASCAPGVSGARQALLAAVRSSESAMTSIVKFDKEYQDKILIEGMKKRQDPQWTIQALFEYRDKRDKLVEVVNKVNAVIATIQALLPLVESGVKKESDVNLWLSKLYVLLPQLYEAMKVFGLQPPVTPFTIYYPPELNEEPEEDAYAQDEPDGVEI
jgi:hypothetical protein